MNNSNRKYYHLNECDVSQSILLIKNIKLNFNKIPFNIGIWSIEWF